MSRLRVLAVAAALLTPSAALAQAAASPFTSATRYDAVGRVTGTISADPDGVGSGNPFLAVRNSYAPSGELIKVETGTLGAWQSESVAPSAWTGFAVDRTIETQYDAMDRKTRDTLREGAAGLDPDLDPVQLRCLRPARLHRGPDEPGRFRLAARFGLHARHGRRGQDHAHHL